MPADLPQIPIIDARSGGAPEIARTAADRLSDLYRSARRLFTPLLLGLGDHAAQRWLERNGNPYLDEIGAIAGLLPGRGAYALNTSYEWCCTSGVGADPQGGVRLLRVLDWWQPGLGRNLVAAWQSGPAGDFVNLTWPGFVGVITAMAPGRFAVAVNQPPMASWGLSLPVNWALARAQVWRSRALSPAHLLRQVCEDCRTYDDAKRALATQKLCLGALFTIAGTRPGEGCVIERTPDDAAVRETPAATANHWDRLAERGRRPRGAQSRERQHQMACALAGAADWLASPIINRDTRMVAAMNPATANLWVQGWERTGPATAVWTLPPSFP